MASGVGSAEFELWMRDHPVLEILRERRAAGSTRGNRTDGAKVALAVEGGGMRGVISAAMLAALEDQGFKDAFDVVYGCSSGSMNGAYFIAGSTWYFVSIYYDDLTTKQFINLPNWFRGKPILNIDYALDEVMDVRKPLDYEAIIGSDLPLIIPVTNVDALRTETLSDFASPAVLKEALRGSAWLPVALPGTMQMSDGRRVVDGGTLTALPFRLALQDECTHVVSLSTKPMGTPSAKLGAQHRYGYFRLERLRRGLGSAYLEAVRKKHEDQQWLAEVRKAPPAEGPFVFDIAPLPWMEELKRHEIDRHLVFENARMAYAVAYCAAEGRDPESIRTGGLRAMPRLTMIDTVDGQEPERNTERLRRVAPRADGLQPGVPGQDLDGSRPHIGNKYGEPEADASADRGMATDSAGHTAG